MNSSLDNEGYNDPNCIDAGIWTSNEEFTSPSSLLTCNYGTLGTQTGLDLFDITDDCTIATVTHETYS